MNHLKLVRQEEEPMCEHGIPPLSCGVCFPDHAITTRDNRIQELERQVERLTLQLLEEVRKRGETLREWSEMVRVRR